MGRAPSARSTKRPARYDDADSQPAAAALLALARPPIAGHRQARRRARVAPVAPAAITAPISTNAGLTAHFKKLRDLVARWPAQIIALINTADRKRPSLTIGGVAWFSTRERIFNGVLHVTKDGKQVCSIKRRAIVAAYKIRRVKVKNYVYHCVGMMGGGVEIRHQVSRLVMRAFHGPCPAGYVVDHINHDPCCNHVHNLRYLSHAHNLINSTKL